MTTPDPPLLSPLGQLLEDARQRVVHISGREAARRAGMSEGRWRQIVRGVQGKAGMQIPVTAPPRTIVAMALAVEVDPVEAVKAAGLDVPEGDIMMMLGRQQRELRDRTEQSRDRAGIKEIHGLADEIDRIRRLRGISPKDRIRMVNALIELHEESERDEDGH